MGKRKPIKHICKNCRLFDPEESVCKVNVLHQGEYLELSVKPNDPCHWEKLEEEMGIEFPISQLRVWSDGKNGYVETN